MEKTSLFEQFPDSSSSVNFESFVSPPPTPNGCCFTIDKTVEMSTCEFMESKDISFKLDCLGRLLKINVNLENVCPRKKVTVGVLIFEDNIIRSFKVREIFTGGSVGVPCKDLNVGTFCFVFKDDNICQPRYFNVKVVANYTDFC